MAIWRKTFRDLYAFRVAPQIPGRHRDEARRGGLLVRKGLVAVLFVLIVLFQVFKRWDEPVREIFYLQDSELILVEDVPITRQQVKQPVPPRPVVPIPSDDPTIPEDLTIEETELDLAPLPPIEGGRGNRPVTPPRPIAEVFPEYPESERKSKVQGEIELALFVDETGRVKNVQMVSNSTQSKACERSAIQAAYQTRFIPARQKNRTVSVWINKIYRFGIN